MDASQWYLLGGFFLAVGGAVLLVTQVLLHRWRKRMDWR